MTPRIHPTALVHPTAELADGVEIGAFAIVGEDCVIGEGSVVSSRATLERNVRLGAGVKIGVGTVLGGDPQDLKYRGEPTFVEIGDGTTIREYTTINRGTTQSFKTTVGKNCFLMSYVHLAHDLSIDLGDARHLAHHAADLQQIELEPQLVAGLYRAPPFHVV
jgi:UDP-N-acetylglucosamine acyltransferase